MAKTTARTGTAPFAHLLALVTGKPIGAKKAEDDEIDDEGEVDPDEIIDDPDTDVDDVRDPDDDADDAKKGKKGKKAKKAETSDSDEEDDDAEEKAESDDDDEDMAKARHEGFLAGQARGRRIFSATSAGLRPDMAAHLAFNEAMPSAQAIAMLDMAANGAAPRSEGGSRIGRRMARVVIPNPGSGGSGARRSEEMSFGEMAKAAAKKAGII